MKLTYLSDRVSISYPRSARSKRVFRVITMGFQYCTVFLLSVNTKEEQHPLLGMFLKVVFSSINRSIKIKLTYRKLSQEGKHMDWIVSIVNERLTFIKEMY